MKRYRIICAVCAAAILLGSLAVIYAHLPDTIVLYKDSEWSSEGRSGLTNLDESIEVSNGVIVPTKAGDYTASLSFWGIPYKSVTLKVLEEKQVIPCGNAIGIRLYSAGLIVVGVGEIGEGKKSPGAAAGIEVGDVITKVNGEDIGMPQDLEDVLAASEGAIELEVKRGDDVFIALVTPEVSDADGKKRLGLWVRDSTAGVGTLTYIDPESMSYGALGHSVSDADTGVRFEVLRGSIERCAVEEIVKSEKGSPGEMRGVFYAGEAAMGSIEKNTSSGIFGTILETPQGEAVDVGLRSDVKRGKAYIRTSLDGESVEEYEIEILRVSPSESNPSKAMMIEVTDERLLEATGGIVQGMSGSPILQDGKFVGAVTHVLVNDPTKGYAILAESMLCAECGE